MRSQMEFFVRQLQKEIVSVYDVEETHFAERTDSRDHKSIYLTTTGKNKYTIDLLKSKPDKIVVYTQGAQVHRTSSVNLVAGQNTIIFTGLESCINTAAIQASGTGNFIIADIIEHSIKNRVLSNYTAFLALEPAQGGKICAACPNNDESRALGFSE